VKLKPSLFFLAACLLLFTGLPVPAQTGKPFWQEAPGQTIHPLVEFIPASFAPLAEKVNPAVVTVYSTKVSKAPLGQGSFPFFGPQHDFRREGVASGFILTADGYILTNNHVVSDSNQVKVAVGVKGQKDYDAKVIGVDPKTDVALIKIEAAELPTVALGDSDQLRVGDWVAAIGSPFTGPRGGPQFHHTLTVGVVSAKGRRLGIGPYDDFIQTDASINPGNSGGPLVNLNGEVVGINTLIISPGMSGGNVGLGFAIPINLAKSILTQLKDKGKVSRSWIGVSVQEVTPELAESFGLSEPRGALVAQVLKGSPAAKVGLEAGDIIMEFAGTPIQSSADLPALAALYGIGKKAELKFLHNGKEESRVITLAAMPEEKELAARTEETGKPARNVLGLKVKELTPALASELGYEGLSGAVVAAKDPNGPLAGQDIQPGDLIQKINSTPVQNVQDFERAVKTLRPGRIVRFYLRRGDASLFLAFPLGQ